MKIRSKNKKNKLSVREKIAVAAFMESVPRIIDLWKQEAPDVPLDVWLLSVYNETKEGGA